MNESIDGDKEDNRAPPAPGHETSLPQSTRYIIKKLLGDIK
jgi:hypothetical protein